MKIAIGLVFVIACGGPQVARVTVDPVPQTSASVALVSLEHRPSVAAFLDAGCKLEPNGTSALDCKGARIDGIETCKYDLHVLPVSFDPPAVVAECFADYARGHAVRTAGCMLPVSVRLLAATPHGFVFIDSPEALAAAFAPVTTPNEALAFAVALTGSGLVKPVDADAKQLGVSEAHADGDEFRARLFTTPICGCHHPTYAVEYAVTRAGAVREVGRQQVWEDPKSRGLCVD